MPGSPVVIDTSIALRWLLPDPLQQACWVLFSRIAESGMQFTVPALWMYEMTSGLAKAVHFKMLNSEDAKRGLLQIAELGIHLISPDAEQSRQAFDWTLRLNRASAYDSYYLAVAETLNCEFWTADRHLYYASRDQGLEWIRHIEEIQDHSPGHHK